MKNLIYQYYIPFRDNMRKGPEYDGQWVTHGIEQGRQYAKRIGAEHICVRKRFMRDPMPVELETIRVWQDPHFDKFDNILIADIDMIFNTDESIFDLLNADIAMVHEHNFREHRSCTWTWDRMMLIMWDLYGYKDILPRSVEDPLDPFRFLNGGIQVWSREGRQKARELIPSVYDYRLKGGTKEQMYINTGLIANPEISVQELPEEWNSMNANWTMDTWRDKKIVHCGGTEGKPRMMEIIKCLS